MSTHQALILSARGSPLQPTTLPIPEATSGTAIIKVLATSVHPGAQAIFSGKVPLPLSTPTTPSSACVGRIHALGTDSSLSKDNLVFCDNYIQSRDDPAISILSGYWTGNDLEHSYKNGTYAEYARHPLERCFKLPESLLETYSAAELCSLGNISIPLAGLLDVGVKAGDVVVVAPATGYFGGAAVMAALGLGAKVLACGRSAEKLEGMKGLGDVEVVVLDGEDDGKKIREKCPERGADVFLDFSPPAAKGYLGIGIGCLKVGGSVVIVGGAMAAEIPYFEVMRKSIRVQGRYMFERWHAETAVRLVETGRIKIGKKAGIEVEQFGMDRGKDMLEFAAHKGGWNKLTVLVP